jgi:hypothetical protein
MYTITIKRRLTKPFLLSFEGKMLNAFIKVNVVNHAPHDWHVLF